MAPKRLGERIEEALKSSPDPEFASRYLDRVLDNMTQAESKFMQIIVVTFFLILGFELLRSAAVTEISIGPFKLSNLHYIQKLLPAAIAYCFFHLISLSIITRLLSYTSATIIQNTQVEFYRNDLHYFLLPHSPFVTLQVLERSSIGWRKWGLSYLPVPVYAFIFLLPPIYVIFALYICFVQFGFSDILLWISVGVTALLVVIAFNMRTSQNLVD